MIVDVKVVYKFEPDAAKIHGSLSLSNVEMRKSMISYNYSNSSVCRGSNCNGDNYYDKKEILGDESADNSVKGYNRHDAL